MKLSLRRVVSTPAQASLTCGIPYDHFCSLASLVPGDAVGTLGNTRAPSHLSFKLCYTVDQSLILPFLLRERSSVSVYLHTIIRLYLVDCSPFRSSDDFLQELYLIV